MQSLYCFPLFGLGLQDNSCNSFAISGKPHFTVRRYVQSKVGFISMYDDTKGADELILPDSRKIQLKMSEVAQVELNKPYLCVKRVVDDLDVTGGLCHHVDVP